MTTSYKRINESIEDLLAQAHYYLAKSRVDGNLTFDGHSKTREEMDNESRCRSLCSRIERALTTCGEEDITALLEMYDLLYRIGYGKMPDQRYISQQKQRVYAAWKSGNGVSLSDNIAYQSNGYNVNNEIHRSNICNVQESQVYNLLPVAEKRNMRSRWFSTLLRHGHFPDVTTYENNRRLTLIMRENLDNMIDDLPCVPEECRGLDVDELKWRWYMSNRVDTDKLSTLSTKLLKAYRTFVASLFPVVLDYEEQQELDSVILDALLSRRDLNPYERRAFELTLSKESILS